MASEPIFIENLYTDYLTVRITLTVTGTVTYSGAIVFNGPVTFNGGLTLGSVLDANYFKIINLATPTAPADAANKAYVDSVAVTGVAAAPNMSVQFNNSGPFGGDANFLWSTASQLLTVGGATPRVMIGTGTADAGAALQLKTNVGTAATQISDATSAPSAVTLQSRVATTTGAPTVLQTLRLTDHTSAYCDVTILGVRTSGVAGQTSIFHLRFSLTRYDSGGGTTFGAITEDFIEAGIVGTSFNVAVSGTDLQIVVLPTAVPTTWDAKTELVVSTAW